MSPQAVEINSTGMYYLYFMFCEPELQGTVIKGRTVWRNPDGYLPGKMAPLMTFFGFMSLAYLLLGLNLVSKVCSVLERYYTVTLSYYCSNCSWNV